MDRAYFRKLAVTRFEGDLEFKKHWPLLTPSQDAEAHFQEVLNSVSHSGLHKPDLIATSVRLHGRVISSAEVDVTPVGGCALQGGAQLGGVSYVVSFLGITTKLPENTRARTGKKGCDLSGERGP